MRHNEVDLVCEKLGFWQGTDRYLWGQGYKTICQPLWKIPVTWWWWSGPETLASKSSEDGAAVMSALPSGVVKRELSSTLNIIAAPTIWHFTVVAHPHQSRVLMCFGNMGSSFTVCCAVRKVGTHWVSQLASSSGLSIVSRNEIWSSSSFPEYVKEMFWSDTECFWKSMAPVSVSAADVSSGYCLVSAECDMKYRFDAVGGFCWVWSWSTRGRWDSCSCLPAGSWRNQSCRKLKLQCW